MPVLVDLPARRLPPWMRRQFSPDGTSDAVARMLDELGLNTVCQSARCPNITECFSRRHVTFMILGDRCTRACRFCAVDAGRPQPVDPEEPAHLADAVTRLQLRHVVVTSVARDDLRDGGAGHFARVITALRQRDPALTIEVLVPDFHADAAAIQRVMAAQPDIFAHNIETVRRLSPRVRSQATYDRSLEVLRIARAAAMRTLLKSSLMVGLGETTEEVLETLRDLREATCELVTIGQYLQPEVTPRQVPAERFVAPETFTDYERQAYALGFRWAHCGPFVRSSYHAGDALARMWKAQREECA